MLYLFYTNLKTNELKEKFIFEIMSKCRVKYMTARTWIANPKTLMHRNPKPIYRGILAEITGIPEEELFKQPEEELINQ